MLFSRDWLAEYVELPGSDEELARALTEVGMAVEGIEARDGDVVFDVEVTTNRPDAMCHLGLAREVAVKLGRPLRPPAVFAAAAGLPSAPAPASAAPGEAAGGDGAPAQGERAEDAVSVHVADPAGCRRYVARVVRGVTVGPSPEWLRRRLTAIGLRPIDNVVDVTNYVLWETGQPLHAFDLAKVPDGRIVVRRAADGERLTTLDGEDRELGPEVLVIADRERPIALAGVMGGLDSEVTAETSDVLLESAHFARRRTRIGARELGLHTDASHRFERGADPGACRAAADRAAELIAELAGGRVVPGAVDARGEPMETPHGTLDAARLSAFTGVEIDPADVERWLAGLGFGLERIEGRPAAAGVGAAPAPRWRVAVPSWRWYDVPPGPDGEVYEADLFEEVVRLHGFDAIPATLPAIAGSDGTRTPEQERRDLVRDHLAACGYAEAVDYAFHSREDDAAFPVLAAGPSEPAALANPLSERYAVLRRSLLPNLVGSARFNLRRGAGAVRLFEVGHVFWRPQGARLSAPAPAGSPFAPELVEQEVVGWVCGGTVGRPWDRPAELDLFDWKGPLDGLAERLGAELEVRPAELTGLVAGASAEIVAGGERVGVFGRVDDPDAETALYAGELFTAALPVPDRMTLDAYAVVVPSRFPAVEADLTFTHPAEVPWAEVRRAVEENRPPDLAGYGLVVRYAGEGVPEGAVNTTIGFRYASPERSLTQEEVNRHQEALRAVLEERFGLRAAER